MHGNPNKDDHGLKQHFVLAVSQAGNAIVTAKSAMLTGMRTKLASGSLREHFEKRYRVQS